MSLPKFDIFLKFPNFPRSQPVCEVCYTRHQVSFCLLQIVPVLKHCKVPKYCDQDCSLSRSTFPFCCNVDVTCLSVEPALLNSASSTLLVFDVL